MGERAKFIAICGIDHSGKSSVIRGLNSYFTKDQQKFININHPPDGWFQNKDIYEKYIIGSRNGITDIDEVEFTINLKLKEQNNVIIPHLNNGYIVLSHRSIFSLFSYYYARKSIRMEYIHSIAGDVIIPDLIIYLKISYEEYLKRKNDNENIPYLNKKDHVLDLIEYYEKLKEKVNCYTVINEGKTKEETIDLCIQAINNTSISKQNLRVSDIWL